MMMESNPLNNKDIASLILMALFYLEITIWLLANILIDIVLVTDIIGRCLVFIGTGALSIWYSHVFRKKVVEPFIFSE